MKLLVVDVGNTSTAVGLWNRGRVSHVRHIDGKGRFEGFEGFEGFGGFEGFEGFEGLDGVAYVSVVPTADRAYRAAFKKLGLPVHQVSHADFASRTVEEASRLLMKEGRSSSLTRRDASSTVLTRRDASSTILTRRDASSTVLTRRDASSTISLDYPKPETIGADRLADAAGAVSRYGAPVLVMDFGTALTAAVITEDRVWRGGVIAPGFPLMRDYLFERTAKLPRMELGKGRPPKIGRSTEEAMRFGALVGYRGMVREIVAQLEANFKANFKLVATGGFARWALRDLDLPFTIDPTLTLYGAGLIASGSGR